METSIDLAEVRRIAHEHDLLLVVLFGSRSAGTARDASDVDLAVLARAPHWDDADWSMGLEADLSRLFNGPEVDLSILNGASPVLRFEVARKGRVLFEERAGTFADYRARAAREYYDDEPRMRRQAAYLARKTQ